MASSIWALDLGSWSLKIVRGTYDKKADTITVRLLEEIPYGELPCGYDAALVEKHREAIIEFRRRYEVDGKDDLCVSVSGSDVFSRFIKLPPVPERVDEIIRYEARQQIPFDIDDVIWDYQPVRDPEEVPEGEEIEVGLFALKTERVDEVLELLDQWRNNLSVIQNAPLAVYNLLAHEGLADETGIVLDIGAASTDILVLNPPRFWVRSLLVAGDDLTNAVVEKFGVSLEEAEQIKRVAARSKHREQIMRVLGPVFDEIASEIQRSLGYYKSLAREVQFERVIMLGSALRMSGAARMMASRLQYPVRTLTELSNIQFDDSVDQEKLPAKIPGFAVPLGLLVQGAGKARLNINLVPSEIAMAGAVSEKKPWLLAAAAGLLLSAGVLVTAEKLYASEVRQIDQNTDWSKVEQVRSLEQRYQQELNKLKQLKNSPLAKLAEGGVEKGTFIDVMAAVTSTLPREVYLADLTVGWRSPSRLLSAARRQQAPARTGGRSAPTGPPAGGGMPDFVKNMQAGGGVRSIPGMGTGGRATSRGGRAERAPAAGSGGRTARRGASLGSDARLVAAFTAESRVVEDGDEFINKEVVQALSKAKFPDTGKPMFEKVELTGEPREVWRLPGSGDLVSAEPASPAQKYLAFGVVAVVSEGGAAR
ncbi:MAG: pilus assembly protein PilM [Candidatus Brocadiia bacterium]